MRTTVKTAGSILVCIMGFAFSGRANDIKVRNVLLRDQDVNTNQMTVQFDLSWENSWCNALNHDAAWVFVKFRAPGSNEWQHAYLSTIPGDHTAASGQISVGTNEIAGINYGLGVFVSSANAHTGTVNYSKMRLRWDYGANGYAAWKKGDEINVSVHAIEMVYVAEGAFFLGSGGTEAGSFTAGPWPGGATTPFAITSENALMITNASGCLWGTSETVPTAIGPAGELQAAFPKGFAAFYCMKYEITQGQYSSFLNLLTTAQAVARYPGYYGTARQTIRLSGDTYVAEAPDRAANYISWADGASYAAWSGLRPMTELEYEKACRGPATPVPNEYPWGDTSITPISSVGGLVGNDGSGTETYSAGNAIYGNTASSPGGPVRVGIFAVSGSTRVQAGASYWGILDMGGNELERAVSVGNAAGRTFTGTHGNGILTVPANWPSIIGPSASAGVWTRGGYWYNPVAALRTSYRADQANSTSERNNLHGFRAVRTSP